MPGRTQVPVVQVGRELVDLPAQRRAGADEAHVALQDVEQLGQLVEAGAAQDVADLGDPGVTGQLEQRARALVVGLHGGQPGLGVDAHRAELEHPELGVAPADPLLAEQDRTAVLPLDQDGDDRQHRRGDEQQRAGDDDVERPLDGPGRRATASPTRRAGAASLAIADTVTRVASKPGRPAWMTTSAPPACSARISPARTAGVDVVGADDDAVGARRRRRRPSSVGELAEPQVAAAGGLGLGADRRRCRRPACPASGWTSAMRTSSIARWSVPTTSVGWTHAALAAVDGQPRAVQRAPGDEEDERQHGGGGDPAQPQGRAEDAVDDEDAAEDGGAGPGDAGQLGRADGDPVGVPHARRAQAEQADGGGGQRVDGSLARIPPKATVALMTRAKASVMAAASPVATMRCWRRRSKAAPARRARHPSARCTRMGAPVVNMVVARFSLPVCRCRPCWSLPGTRVTCR